MLRSYLKIAIRNLRKQKGYALINVTGLAVGLAASFFVLLWVQSELSHDRFLEEGDRVYGVWRTVHVGDATYTWSATSKPLLDVLKADYPAIEQVVHSFGSEFAVRSGEESYREEGSFVSSEFFDVFPFPFITGSPETALEDPSSAVVTDRLARRLFDEDWQPDDVVGSTLTIDQRKDFTISGVMADPPRNSSFQSDLLLSSGDYFERNPWVEQWGSNSFPLYVKLREGASPDEVTRQIAGVVMEHEDGADETLFLKPYEEIYLYSDYEDGVLVGGRIEYVRIFSVVAVFLLLIASINFMNLATARSTQRAREIGVRKAIGAHRRSVVLQFLTESILVACLAFFLAVVLVLVLLPAFNLLTDKQFTAADLSATFLALGLGITLAVGLLAGSYPALYLSSFHPLAILRGTFRPRSSAAVLRRGLVVFQFSLSVLLIVGTIAVYLQIDYIRSRDVGLDRSNVIHLAQEGELKSQYEAVRQELLRQPGIANVTAASANPLMGSSSTESATWEGKAPDEQYEISIVNVDFDYFETMRMEIVQGRAFSRDRAADSDGFIVNQRLATLMGENVLGKELRFWGNSGPVIGVVKDFDMNTVYNPDEPVILWLLPEGTDELFVRAHAGETQQAIASLRDIVEGFAPAYPFSYRFLDQDFEAMYRGEVVLGTLANVFAGIAIFISCLGLFGLVSFSAAQRTKEIGIRKVLGARVTHVVVLLAGEATKLVVLGIFIAIPVAYYVVHAWLDRFADQIEVGFGMFAAAGIAAVVIAWMTVSVQSIKAALADPVKSLRYE